MRRKCQWKCDDVKNCVEVLCWSQALKFFHFLFLRVWLKNKNSSETYAGISKSL